MVNERSEISVALTEFERHFDQALDRFERQFTVRFAIILVVAEVVFIAIMKLT